MAYGLKAPSNWGMNYGSQNVPSGNADYLNSMDLASDGYPNSGIPNVGGLSYGQSMGGGATAAAGSPWYKSLFDSKDDKGITTQGMLGTGISAAGSIFNAYMGMKQYGLAKEQFAFNKDMTTRNFNAQANLTNSHLADRQSARRAAGENVADPASYMREYGVKKV
jgi:hypothetical protein